MSWPVVPLLLLPLPSLSQPPPPHLPGLQEAPAGLKQVGALALGGRVGRAAAVPARQPEGQAPAVQGACGCAQGEQPSCSAARCCTCRRRHCWVAACLNQGAAPARPGGCSPTPPTAHPRGLQYPAKAPLGPRPSADSALWRWRGTTQHGSVWGVSGAGLFRRPGSQRCTHPHRCLRAPPRAPPALA